MNFAKHIRQYFVAKEAGRGPPKNQPRTFLRQAVPVIIYDIID